LSTILPRIKVSQTMSRSH